MNHFTHNPPTVHSACASLKSEPIHRENGVFL